MTRKTLYFFFSMLSALSALAQTGTLRGTIKDAKSKEAIIGATVRVDGTQLGASTDVEGAFTVGNVPAGTHKVIVSYISYETREIPGVRIESGNTTQIETEIEEEGKALQEVIVTGSRATNTEVAVITEIKQMKPIAVGISAAQIQKSQDRDAAAAIRRVPGVSIIDNRFVLVRGLASRYNTVLVNDIITPSTEVDVRSFSFDLIPSNILDRMIIYKSGAAELPGDFAGGVIKIYTKKRPPRNFTDAGLTVGYRGNTTFQNVQTHERGGLNWLGLYDAKSTVPTSFPATAGEFNTLSPLQRASYARLLPNNWGTQALTVAPDVRFALNTGRRFEVGDVLVSNLTNVNYSLTNQFADVELNFYQNGQTANDIDSRFNDAQFSRSTRLGVLHNWSARFSPRFNLEWKTLFNQLGFTETVVRTGESVSQGRDLRSFSERFEARSILTSQLAGEHKFNDLTSLNWIGSFGYTGRWEPDWKRVRFQRQQGESDATNPFRVSNPNDPNPSESGRFYSRLGERVYTVAVNGEHTFGNPSDREPSKIRFGVYGERKDRDFSARFYGYQNVGNVSAISALPLGELFSPQNVSGQAGGFALKDGTKGIDSYLANSLYTAAYVGGDLYFTPRLSTTLGFRGEYFRQELPGFASNNKFSPLPSLNLTYKLTDRHNLRLAYSYTVNRPEFRELAPFSFFDFNFSADVRGNPALRTATIQNLDAKWEFYPTPNELISVTAFHKDFRNPIESFLLPTANGLAYTFINAKQASSTGVEIEVRKGFSESRSGFFRNLTVVGNVSLIQSRIDLGQTLLAPDLSGAVQTLNVGNITDTRRPMQNQSPYLVNLGVYYANPKTGWQANLLYNVFGPRIFAVGNLDTPTIYEMPRHVVDLNVSKVVNRRVELRLGVQDLLNQYFRLSQDFNRNGKIDRDVTSKTENADQIYRQFRRGSYSTLTLVYSFGQTIVP